MLAPLFHRRQVVSVTPELRATSLMAAPSLSILSPSAIFFSTRSRVCLLGFTIICSIYIMDKKLTLATDQSIGSLPDQHHCQSKNLCGRLLANGKKNRKTTPPNDGHLGSNKTNPKLYSFLATVRKPVCATIRCSGRRTFSE